MILSSINSKVFKALIINCEPSAMNPTFFQEYSSNVLLILSIAFCFISWYLCFKKKNLNPPLPPGPRGLPLLGYLLSIDANLHTCFAKLSKVYGPIMKIKLGSSLCIVIHSSELAKEVYKDNDTVFSNRHVTAVAYAGTLGGTNLIWSPPGERWRLLRKLCIRSLLNNYRLDALYDLRRREVRSMVNLLFFKTGDPIDIGDLIFHTAFNMMANMMWGGGTTLKHFAAEFREELEICVALIMAPNISDLYPCLASFDLQGLAKKIKNIQTGLSAKFDTIIEQRLQMKDQGEMEDFLQVLLQMKDSTDQKTPFTITDVKALLMDILAGGTKSSSSKVEWAMTELLNQPKLMMKVQKEIEEVVGKKNVVEESHCANMPYLNAIVTETFRLHPGAPFLFPRYPSESCVIGGYTIPKGTMTMVNVWAIQRDPKHWDNPLEFRPERFLGSSDNINYRIDYYGNNFNFFPFGSGRRVCAGIPLAERVVPYLLATLLHQFDWKLPKGTQLDLTEKFGLELKKIKPLITIATPRLADSSLYT